jgi:hypothetical protein
MQRPVTQDIENIEQMKIVGKAGRTVNRSRLRSHAGEGRRRFRALRANSVQTAKTRLRD